MVIAIIAVLAALLLPALRSARESALQVACLGQMRQWCQAAVLYANDHDDDFPAYAPWYETRGWTGSPWFETAEGAAYARGIFNISLGVYLGGREIDTTGPAVHEIMREHARADIRQCPAGRTASGGRGTVIGPHYGGFDNRVAPFIYLRNGSAGAPYQPASYKRMNHPSSWIAFLDCSGLMY
ncbi:MAG: hypothetical protein O3B84_05690, partial [Chloroflexi bacterium]|nr:hypothetical protein [Chloroflexota bacterium]